MKKILIRIAKKAFIRLIEKNSAEIIDMVADRTDIPHLNEDEEKKLAGAVLEAAIKIIKRA